MTTSKKPNQPQKRGKKDAKPTGAPPKSKNIPASNKNWRVLPKGTDILKVAEKMIAKAKVRRRNPKAEKGKTRTKSNSRKHVAAKIANVDPKVKQQLSNSERLTIIAKRAVHLYGIECKSYRQIARQLFEEFKLEAVPPLPTLARWMTIGKAEFLDDLNDLRAQFRIQQFNEAEELKAQWHEAAMRNIYVRRYEMVDGERMEVVDDNAFKEQAKAADVYIKLMARQAALLGLDVTKEPDATGKQGSAQEIYLWISNQINYVNQHGEKRVNGDAERFGALELALDSGGEDEL